MNFFFHIGYPKTATKLLQTRILNNLDNYAFLGLPYSNEILKEIMDLVISSSDEDFETKKNYIENQILEQIKKINKKNFIISDERIITNLAFNTLEKKMGHKIENTIKRLHQLFSKFGKVKIMFVIRKHTDILDSFFYQCSIDSYLNFDLRKKDIIDALKGKSKNFIFILENFYYGKFYKFIKSMSNDNKVLIYEDLVFKKEKFFNELKEFFQLPNSELESRINDLDKPNSRISRKKIIYKALKPSFRNVMENIFNLNAYKNKFFYLKKRIVEHYIKNYDLKNMNLNEYKNDVVNFYSIDLNYLPDEIKQQLKSYKYFQ